MLTPKTFFSAIIISFYALCHASQEPKPLPRFTKNNEQLVKCTKKANNRIFSSLQKYAQTTLSQKETLCPLNSLVKELRTKTYYSTAENSKKLDQQLIQKIQAQLPFNVLETPLLPTISLLESLLKGPFPPKDSIHYLLGCLYALDNNLTESEKNFSLNSQDWMTQWNLFMIAQNQQTTKVITQNLIDLFETWCSCPMKDDRQRHAYKNMYSYLAQNADHLINNLLEQNEYELADNFTTLLLKNKKTTIIAIAAIHNLATKIYNEKYATDNTEIKNMAEHYIRMLHVSKACTTFLSIPLDQFSEDIHELAGELYNNLGAQLENIDYLNKAIQLNNIQAAFNKAHPLLADEKRTLEQEAEALDLLKQCISSTDPCNVLAANTLTELYYESSIRPNLLKYIPCDNELSYKYLQQAFLLENNDCIAIWGLLHHHGIVKNGHCSLKPNQETALECLSQHLDNEEKYPILSLTHEMRYTRGTIYFQKGFYKQAIQDFQAIDVTELPASIQAHISMYLLACAFNECQDLIHNPNTQAEVLAYLLPLVDKGAYNNNIYHLPLIQKDIQHMLTDKTNIIMSTNQTTKEDLEWCYFVGKLYTGRLFLNKPHHANYFYGIECLKYAADNNLYEAQLTIGNIASKYLSLPQRTNYLLKAHKYALQHSPAHLETTPKIILNACIPSNIVARYTLLEEYQQNATLDLEAVTLYLESLFSVLFVTQTKTITLEEKDTLIKKCSQNNFLQNYRRVFLENPEKATKALQNAAALSAIIYSNSCEENYLLQATNLLEKLYKCNNNYATLHEQYLPDCYYKLGLHYHKKNERATAMSYMHCAAALDHKEARNYVIQTNVKTKSPLTPDIIKAVLEENSSINDRQKRREHPSCLALSSCKESPFSKNFAYQNALLIANIDLDKANQTLDELAKKSPSHPHAAIKLALYHFHNNTTRQKQAMCALLIKRAFEQGITNVNNQVKFIDTLFLDIIVEIIETGISKTAKSVPPIIRTLLKTIQEKGIPMNTFKDYIYDVTGINLSNYKI